MAQPSQYVSFSDRVAEYREALSRVDAGNPATIGEVQQALEMVSVSARSEADDPDVRAVVQGILDEVRPTAEALVARHPSAVQEGRDYAALNPGGLGSELLRDQVRYGAAGQAASTTDPMGSLSCYIASSASSMLTMILKYRWAPGSGFLAYEDGAWTEFEAGLDAWISLQEDLATEGGTTDPSIPMVQPLVASSAGHHLSASVYRRVGDPAVIARLQQEIEHRRPRCDQIMAQHAAIIEPAWQQYVDMLAQFQDPSVAEMVSEPSARYGHAITTVAGAGHHVDALLLSGLSTLEMLLRSATEGPGLPKRSDGPSRDESLGQVNEVLTSSDPERLRSPLGLYEKVAAEFENPADPLLGLLDMIPEFGGLLGAVSGIAKAGVQFLGAVFDEEARKEAILELATELVDGFLDSGLEAIPILKFADLGQNIGGMLVKVAEFTDVELAASMGEALQRLDLDEWTDRFSDALVDSLVAPRI